MKKKIVMVLVLTLGLTMGVAKADFTFGTPSPLGPEINTSAAEVSVCVSSDGLSLYFSSMRGGGFGDLDLWESKRQKLTENWMPAINLGPNVNTSAFESNPSISSDGLTLYFSDSIPGFTSPRPGGYGQGDLWMSTRLSKDDAWDPAQNLGAIINTPFNEQAPHISADGLSLFFATDRDGGYGSLDIWVSTRQTKQESWKEPVNLGQLVNSPKADSYVCLSRDGLCFFLSSIRPPSIYWDIWITTRKTPSAPWSQPLLLGETINSDIQDFSTAIQPDGSAFYFASRISGFMDIFEVPIDPVVDLNGDGIVDAADMCIVVDNWGTDNQLCDVGPMPWGDGVVDVEDLIVLAEHLFEVYPSAETVDVNEADNGGQVELELGKLLAVTLESNPSTGYRWELVENNESVLKQFGQAEFKPVETSDPPMVGAGGWEIFRFKAVSAGQMTLELVYHRSWEDVEPLKTFSIQVTVP